MVTNVTSLTGNGLKDWLIQRITSIYFAAYACFILVFFMRHPYLTYNQWAGLFNQNSFKVASVIALIAMLLHTWVGIWTVTTDYLKCTMLRLPLQCLVLLLLLGELVWGWMIVGGKP